MSHVSEAGAGQVIAAAGATEGRIAAPWAFDQNWVALETRYDVRSDGTLRQHFTPVKLAKVTKSIVSVAQRSATVRRAVDRLGGAYNAAVKTVQYQANELKRRADGASWAKAIPSFRMTAQQKQDAARISGFLGGNVWTLLGFGSCAEIVMELRR